MSSRRRLRRKVSRSEFIQKLRVKCPVCGKTCAESETEAWEMARRQFERFGGEMPQRVYQCSPNVPFWHWTRLVHAPMSMTVIEDRPAPPIVKTPPKIEIPLPGPPPRRQK